MKDYPQFHIVDHPLLKRDLSLLRDKNTPHGRFRKILGNASSILAYEALRDIQLKEYQIETPLEPTTGYKVAEEVVLVPILRAGLGMTGGLVRYIPEARIGHLGMYRDEETLKPVDYYSNIPGGIEKAHVFVVDPMLATGGSAIGALNHLKNHGAKRMRFLCILAAPEGVENLASAFPEVPIYTAALDDCLDENGYIHPGLGDAGDRIWGTF